MMVYRLNKKGISKILAVAKDKESLIFEANVNGSEDFAKGKIDYKLVVPGWLTKSGKEELIVLFKRTDYEFVGLFPDSPKNT